ncbi:MAG: N-acetyltransferase [Nitrospinota bacterium]|nr:GNAT family N-acetyltransferase [Nitrospinota bacterium]
MKFRGKLKKSDIPSIEDIVRSTGFFHDYEVDIALELVEENINKGEEKSGYIFNLAEIKGKPVGYSCYGQTPCTAISFDLYWIAVHDSERGNGIGKILIEMAEADIAARGGENIWVETSSRPLYQPTQKFYLKCGYKKVAELPDFYAKGDNKIVYVKRV